VSIFGAGGGGGKSGAGGRKATEAKDNLDSTSYAKIIELLSEGEIEGYCLH
jgi:predicted phage tail protein